MAPASAPRNLKAFFAPRSVVLVGGSDRSAWSQLIFGGLGTGGFTGDIHIVNRRGASAHGLPGHRSCGELPAVPDIAFLFVPQDGIAAAIEDAAAAGIPNVVLLSSGYAEAGDEGAARQRELAAIARAGGVNLLGPNSLGFINYPARVALAGFPFDEHARPGGIAVISQSGATAHVIARFARQQGIGLSTVVATGNEADIALSHIVAHLADDAPTRAIAIFAETIRDSQGFLAAVRAAALAGKPIVVLKVGSSPLAAQLAQAHTGSVTGDDRIFDAVCRQHNIVRVDSIEALATTAALLADTGRIVGGVAIASISGGACEVIADRAAAAGLDLPEFSRETKARLREMLPDFGSVSNPLDVTGAAVRDPGLYERILAVLAHDPEVDLVACVQDLPSDANDTYSPDLLAAVGRGLARGKRPGVLLNQALRPLGAFSREIMDRYGLTITTSGLHHGVAALAAAQRWSRHDRAVTDRQAVIPSTARPRSEHATLNHLAGAGVDGIPFRLVSTAGEAIEAWRAIGGPVVLKIASSDIAHKSDIGGVKLNLDGEDAVRQAFAAVDAAASAAFPQARIDGCIVAPMRTGGIEMFVGTARSTWGPVIVAGLGGIWIEALDDTSLRLLPITTADARDMFNELRGRRILDGYRGAPPADLDALADVIVRIGDAALALGPDLVSLEVNPLLVRGATIEALDALAIWDDAADTPEGAIA